MFHTTTVRIINAFIKIDNLKSINAFEKAHYKKIGQLQMHGKPSVRYVRERGELLNKPINLEKALSLFSLFTAKGIKNINTNFMFGLHTEK